MPTAVPAEDQSPGRILDLTRRTFVGGATAALAGLSASAAAASPPAADGAPGTLDLAAGSGYWLGERFWGNRMQDWMSRAGRLECVAPASRVGRTVGLLTNEVKGAPFDLVVRTGTLTGGTGFSGFVVGTGVPGEDSRRRALVASASGIGGGLIAAYGSDGVAHFREHTNELDQFAYAVVPAETSGSPRPRTTGEDITLRLAARVAGTDRVTLTLTASATGSGHVLSRAVLADIAATRVRGGVSLISSGRGDDPSRYWFTGLTLTGVGVRVVPDRALGPVVGALYTCASGILRMTVQLMPLDPRTLSTVALEVKRGSSWQRLGQAAVGPGYTALFRVTGFDNSAAVGYRIVGGGATLYSGTIAAEPRGGALRVGSINCTKASHRPLDSISPWDARLPGSHKLDLYSVHNVYFPHNELVATVTRSRPNLLVFHGDQLYETSPTAKDASRAPELDYLYKFLLWHWAMRPLTRRLPTVVLTDDHDVFQGNLWGQGGVPNSGAFDNGGYTNDPDWVNLVQRMSSWHNPERYNTDPINQNITVGYAAFTYGGVSFAIVEDRKFKSGPESGTSDPQLLGGRQEAFLGTWAGMHPGQPKLLLTQSTWACVQTEVDGRPRPDFDSHGWPPAGRARAVALARDAHALILAGDQHLGSLVRHGLSSYADGPLQFTPPAASTSFQRWFQPEPPLPNSEGTPHTGDFTDAFGNRMRVLAVCQPRFTMRELWDYFPAPRQDYGDRNLKREGFGLVAFDHGSSRVTLECWPWNAVATGHDQYAGWPVTVPYSAL